MIGMPVLLAQLSAILGAGHFGRSCGEAMAIGSLMNACIHPLPMIIRGSTTLMTTPMRLTSTRHTSRTDPLALDAQANRNLS